MERRACAVLLGRYTAQTSKSFPEYDPDYMKTLQHVVAESGKIGYALLWMLGVPLPILLIIYLVRGS